MLTSGAAAGSLCGFQAWWELYAEQDLYSCWWWFPQPEGVPSWFRTLNKITSQSFFLSLVSRFVRIRRAFLLLTLIYFLIILAGQNLNLVSSLIVSFVFSVWLDALWMSNSVVMLFVLQEIKAVEFKKPVGWVHIPLSGTDPRYVSLSHAVLHYTLGLCDFWQPLSLHLLM